MPITDFVDTSRPHNTTNRIRLCEMKRCWKAVLGGGIHIARTIDRFTEIIGFDRYAVYVFDYGAPTGFRLAVKHPERITAIISQNGKAYEEGLSDGWTPIRAYWQDRSAANREALRAFLKPETTIWQYTHGAPDPTGVSPDGYTLDNFYMSRPGVAEVQLDLFGDYKSNVALY